MAGNIQCSEAESKLAALELYTLDLQATLANELMTGLDGREPVNVAVDGTLNDDELKIIAESTKFLAETLQCSDLITEGEGLMIRGEIADLRDFIANNKSGIKYWSGINFFGKLYEPTQNEDNLGLVSADIIHGNNDGVTDFAELIAHRLIIGSTCAKSQAPVDTECGSYLVSTMNCEFDINNESVITLDESLKRTSLLAYGAVAFLSGMIAGTGPLVIVVDIPECSETDTIPDDTPNPTYTPVRPASPDQEAVHYI